MGKWLAAGSVVVIALLVLLWMQLRAPAEAAVVPAPDKPAVQPAAAPAAPPADIARAMKKVEAAQASGDKMTTDSDEFFNTYQDVVTQVATRNAMQCYTGGLHTLHRNAKVKFAVRDVIKNGEATITEVKVVESTINDPELIACMQKAIADTKMKNDRWPDWNEPDMVLIRPGRNVNKFSKEAMEYEGSGPDFTKEHPVKGAQ